MEGEVNEALLESNELLQEEVSRLRNNNRMLRTVISALRKTNTVLSTQVEIASANDEAFKSMCQESVIVEEQDVHEATEGISRQA